MSDLQFMILGICWVFFCDIKMYALGVKHERERQEKAKSEHL